METPIMRKIMLELGKIPAIRIFRNHVGVGYHGQVVERVGSTIVLKNARTVTFGLAKRSPDLIGWRELTITPDMVGKKLAQFIGCEVKDEHGKLSIEQSDFIALINSFGGCAFSAKSPAEAVQKISVIHN